MPIRTAGRIFSGDAFQGEALLESRRSIILRGRVAITGVTHAYRSIFWRVRTLRCALTAVAFQKADPARLGAVDLTACVTVLRVPER